MNLNKWAKAAMLLAIVQLIVLLTCESLVMEAHLAELDALMAINSTNPGWLLLVNETSNSIIPFAEADTIYEGIFIAAQIFMVYLAFDAIISSSKIQLIATTVFSLAMFGYSCEQYVQSANLITSSAIGATHYGFLQTYGFQFHRTAPYEIAVIAAGLLFFLVWCFVAFKLYDLFAWNVFKELGADVEVRKRLTLYHIYMMLLKLDVFFFLSFVIQYVLLVFGDTNSMAKTVNIVVSPIAVVVLLLIAYFAVTRESNLLMTFLLVGLSGGVGYLVDRVIDIWTVTDPTKYKSSKTSLTLFTVLTLIAALITFAIAVLNFLNFGKGLMQSLKNKRTPVHTMERQNPLEMPAISTGATSVDSASRPLRLKGDNRQPKRALLLNALNSDNQLRSAGLVATVPKGSLHGISALAKQRGINFPPKFTKETKLDISPTEAINVARNGVRKRKLGREPVPAAVAFAVAKALVEASIFRVCHPPQLHDTRLRFSRSNGGNKNRRRKIIEGFDQLIKELQAVLCR
ncbi:hypothetical protein HDU84_003760 [Entophlyctis sp. JEL0112]|nr:hypothetical protein HDU84_003760 [Entophlyctis sp. JEL0112]